MWLFCLWILCMFVVGFAFYNLGISRERIRGSMHNVLMQAAHLKLVSRLTDEIIRLGGDPVAVATEAVEGELNG